MIVENPFLVYKSSAGSGKTFNLAKVFLVLLLKSEDPSYFKRILAITFTVKAAAEMKDRILTYLSVLAGHSIRHRSDAVYMLADIKKETGLSQDQIEKQCGEILHEILHNYSDFSIVTIDKFFARLIRSFASDLAIAPDFEIQVDEQLFIDRIMELFYDEVGQKAGLTELILHMTKHRLAEDRSGDADSAIKTACRNLLSDEFYFVKDRFKSYEPDQIVAIKNQLATQESELKESLFAPAREALSLIESFGLSAEDFYRGKSGIVGFFNHVLDEKFDKVLAPNSYVTATIEENKWQSGRKNEGVFSIQAQLEKAYHNISGMQAEIEQLMLVKALQKEIYSLGIYSELDRLFKLVREEDNMRLLREFNTLIADQLQNEQTSFIYERIGSQYKHILIDEFQDTSTLQWKNLLPLVENSLSEGNISLIVGDAKQSIYRFRNSEPEQFVQLPEVNHASSALFRSAYTEVQLDQNFRSNQNIVAFNQRFFDLLSEDFLDPGSQKTYVGHAQKPVLKDKGSVYWWISNNKEDKKDDLLLQMTDRIRHLIDSKGVSPGDICCLFRTNSEASLLASTLLQSGFSVVSQESLLLRNNPSVQLINATLKALANPKDPFGVQQWLSKAGQYYAWKDLHQKAKSAKEKRLDFHQLVTSLNINLKHPDLEHGDTFSKAMAICEKLNLPTDTPFVAKYLDICLNYESNATYLKRSFEEHWKLNEDKASIQLTSDGNAITVMTMHKSKGLEFPVAMVLLPEFSVKKTTKEYSWVNVESPINLGEVSLALSDLKTSSFAQLTEDEAARSKLDLANLTYVAFTRAQQRLEIFSKKPAKDNFLNKITTWPEWNKDLSALVIED